MNPISNYIKIFEDKTFWRKNGNELIIENDVIDDLKTKVIVIYFSANWIKYSSDFTQKLKDFYEELNHKDFFEVIFVTFDRSEFEFNQHIKTHGNWLYLNFGDNAIKELSEYFNIKEIPTLVMFKKNGEIYKV